MCSSFCWLHSEDSLIRQENFLPKHTRFANGMGLERSINSEIFSPPMTAHDTMYNQIKDFAVLKGMGSEGEFSGKD